MESDLGEKANAQNQFVSLVNGDTLVNGGLDPVIVVR
jgi:hypothetical protein